MSVARSEFAARRVQAPARGARVAARGLWRSLRARQWLKNAVVLAAPGAAGILDDGTTQGRLAAGFVVFCALASATYLLNDIRDAAQDRCHPVKCRRPIAAGMVSPVLACEAAMVLLVGGLALAALVGPGFLAVAAVYVGLTGAYTLWLKRVPVLDVAAVAGCFVLRALAGAAAARVPASGWFLVVVCAAALLVVLGKRHGEHLELGSQRAAARATLAIYSPRVLRLLWLGCGTIAVVAYTLWALLHPERHLGVSWSALSVAPFVTGVVRYARLLDGGRGGAPEDLILGDRTLQLVSVAWAGAFAAGVYLGG